MLGTVDGRDGRQLTVADVPGLIEGASEGIGLGHEFLAHLERARLLLHVIDASEGDADERFSVIDRELSAYGAGLGERPQLVVLNKSDLDPDPAPFTSRTSASLPSTASRARRVPGIDELKSLLFALCEQDVPEPAPVVEEVPAFLEYRPRPPERRQFRVLRTGQGFRIVGVAPEGEELEAALRDAGVRRGSEVEIGDEVVVWESERAASGSSAAPSIRRTTGTSRSRVRRSTISVSRGSSSASSPIRATRMSKRRRRCGWRSRSSRSRRSTRRRCPSTRSAAPSTRSRRSAFTTPCF